MGAKKASTAEYNAKYKPTRISYRGTDIPIYIYILCNMYILYIIYIL